MNSSDTSLKFIDSLTTILDHCRSGDPNHRTTCIIHTALGAVTGLILPLFIATGLVGNSLVVYINLVRESPWTRQNVYISVIAVADICNMFVVGFMWMFLAKGLPWLSNGSAGFITVNISEVMCRIIRYLDRCCHTTSAALFMLMVLDRVLSLYFPFKFQGVSGKTAMRVSLVVVFGCLLVTVPVLYLYRWVYFVQYVVCYVDYNEMQEWMKTALGFYDLLLYFPPLLYLVPIFLCNLLLVHRVRQILANRKSLTSNTVGSSQSASDKQSLVNTIVCLTLSVCLIVSFIPVVIAIALELVMSRLDPNIAEEKLQPIWGVFDLGLTLVNMNQAVTWLFLAWKNRKFRDHLKDIFTCNRN